MTDQNDPPDTIRPPTDRETDPATTDSEPESDPIDAKSLGDMVSDRLRRVEDGNASLSRMIIDLRDTAKAIKAETDGVSRALHDIMGHLAVIRANQDHLESMVTIVSDGVTDLVTRTAKSADRIEKLEHLYALHMQHHRDTEPPPSGPEH